MHQINIKHTAEIARLPCVAADDIALEIHPLTLKIASVVEMHIRLLLRIGGLKQNNIIHQIKNLLKIVLPLLGGD